MENDDDYFKDFVSRANNLLEDKYVGEALCHSRSDDIADIIDELDFNDLKVLINFFLTEGILVRDEDEV